MISQNTTTAQNDVLVFTRLTNAKGSLTKSFALDETNPDGKPTSRTRAQLFDGMAETVAVPDLGAFANELSKVRHDQAFAFGVTGYERIEITTAAKLRESLGKIARDRKHFRFRAAPGLFMLDHDAGYLPVAYDTPQSLRSALLESVPGLALAPMLWCASASTFIVNSDSGEVLRGAGGARIYFPVSDTSDIPRAMTALREYLWAAGIGVYSVSKSGQLIERTLFDLQTAQPERLDFVAGAKCSPPLVQRRPEPVVFEAEIIGGLDPIQLSAYLPDPDDVIRARANENRAAARRRITPESQRVRQIYRNERISELAQRGVADKTAEATIDRALDSEQLAADFLLRTEQGEVVTVATVLDDVARWHGTRFADPLEPDYGADGRIAYANLRGGGRPYIYSHAHGGKRYELFRQPTILEVRGGDVPRLVDACVALMSQQMQVFDGPVDGMLRVGTDARLYPVTLAWLTDHLGRIVTFTKFDARSKAMKPIDVPPQVPMSILAREGQRDLPRLIAAVTAPTLRADGSVLDIPGYDPTSELLYLSARIDVPRVPAAPTLAEVADAVRLLWKPVGQFPFDGPASRAVMLAAMLTACVRPGLPTAPAFAIDAPAAGTGKTLLARCIALLGGHAGETTPLPGAEDERRKTIFALLRAGAGTITFDNVSGVLGGEAFDQAMTAPMYSSRVLGESRAETVPNRALVLVTGNNLVTRGDTNRRVLRCRIDAATERPYQRQFDFNPAQMIAEQRLELVAAALTILRGYLTTAPRRGSLASFEEWDTLVRNAVLWLSEVQDVVQLGDPVSTITDADESDTSKGCLLTFLTAWTAMFGAKPVTAAAVLSEADGFDELDDGTQAKQRNEQRLALMGAMEEAVRAESRKVGSITARELGDWLRAHRDTVVGDMRLECAGKDRNGLSEWRVAAACLVSTR